MSRSIHTTRKSVAAITNSKFASAETKANVLVAAHEKLARKRRIKRQVAGERKRPAPPLSGMNPDTIPIEEHHAGPYVHHSVTVPDLRAILRLLPDAAKEGISSIKLIMGKEYLDERFSGEHDKRDPFTGRLTYELLPGVYGGLCSGTYSPSRGQIALLADVYDPANLPLATDICELYLRLHALTVFVHEVAHHHDGLCRVGRGRWLADRTENCEWYAEKMQHEWTQQIVVPYLERTYGDEVCALLDFVEHKGGVRLPLAFFAGDPRHSERDGSISTRGILTTSGAFEDWVGKLSKCADLGASRTAFAWELHYVNLYPECLQILEGVLVQNPNLQDALVCKADTFVHLERYDEALVIADLLLSQNPRECRAWDIRGDILVSLRNWTAVLDNCDRWLANLPDDPDTQFYVTHHRAIAYCGLGDTGNMETWINAWVNFGNRKRNAESIRKSVYRRAGKS